MYSWCRYIKMASYILNVCGCFVGAFLSICTNWHVLYHANPSGIVTVRVIYGTAVNIIRIRVRHTKNSHPMLLEHSENSVNSDERTGDNCFLIFQRRFPNINIVSKRTSINLNYENEFNYFQYELLLWSNYWKKKNCWMKYDTLWSNYSMLWSCLRVY